MKLIDADVLENDGWNMHRTRQVSATEMIYETKKPTDFSAVDAVPVIHGKWKEYKDYPGLAYLCSECGYFTTMRSYQYCPNCGARMDGAERREECQLVK